MKAELSTLNNPRNPNPFIEQIMSPKNESTSNRVYSPGRSTYIQVDQRRSSPIRSTQRPTASSPLRGSAANISNEGINRSIKIEDQTQERRLRNSSKKDASPVNPYVQEFGGSANSNYLNYKRNNGDRSRPSGFKTATSPMFSDNPVGVGQFMHSQ